MLPIHFIRSNHKEWLKFDLQSYTVRLQQFIRNEKRTKIRTNRNAETIKKEKNRKIGAIVHIFRIIAPVFYLWVDMIQASEDWLCLQFRISHNYNWQINIRRNRQIPTDQYLRINRFAIGGIVKYGQIQESIKINLICHSKNDKIEITLQIALEWHGLTLQFNLQ